MDDIYDKMKDDIEVTPMKHTEQSQIRQFFAGKTIFITGGTGFVGKCVVEKLLRGCPEISKIYLMIRKKKDMLPEQRSKKYFSGVLFDKLRSMYPDYEKQVEVISGELTEPDLGLAPEARRKVTETTDIIIHNAAIVAFDCRLSLSLKTNVIGTKHVLDLAYECTRLSLFIYVSTAYCHCYNLELEEKFLPPPANLKRAYELIKLDSETAGGLSEDTLKDILGKWTNVYTFTKSIAERVVQDYATNAPFICSVFRPSVVSSTWKEPIESWCENMNGPVPMTVALALGILHALYMTDNRFNLVPADLTANALLAVAWDSTVNKKKLTTPHLYNHGSSSLNPVNAKLFHQFSKPEVEANPSMKMVWKIFVIHTKCYYYFYICHVLFHFLPALLYDASLFVRRKETFALALFFKIHRNLDKLITFGGTDWYIEMTSFLELWDRMNKADHEQFNSDPRTIDWATYLHHYWRGLRTYILKEPQDTIPEAQRRRQRLLKIHYALVTLIALFVLYFVYRIASSIFCIF